MRVRSDENEHAGYTTSRNTAVISPLLFDFFSMLFLRLRRRGAPAWPPDTPLTTAHICFLVACLPSSPPLISSYPAWRGVALLARPASSLFGVMLVGCITGRVLSPAQIDDGARGCTALNAVAPLAKVGVKMRKPVTTYAQTPSGLQRPCERENRCQHEEEERWPLGRQLLREGSAAPSLMVCWNQSREDWIKKKKKRQSGWGRRTSFSSLSLSL